MPARAAFAETTQAAQTGAKRLTGLRTSKKRLGDGGSLPPRGGISNKNPDLLRRRRMTLRRFSVLVCSGVLVVVAGGGGLAEPAGLEKESFSGVTSPGFGEPCQARAGQDQLA